MKYASPSGFVVNCFIKEGEKLLNLMLMFCVLILGRAQEQLNLNYHNSFHH
jgi:hypothetical protein